MTTVTLDDELYRRAQKMLDQPVSAEVLVSEALETFIRLRAAQRLAALGGSQPEMHDIPRYLQYSFEK
ncbi:MAG: hypothetical protein Q4D61_04595 [Cardiobacteriaceae bacterium]|nr:hypothetical protein [Cardiobacteriaceae bacterium]